MKRHLLLITLIACSINLFSQVTLRGSMGISIISSPSLKDYLNENFAPPDNQVGTFTTAVNFSGEADFTIGPAFEMGLEGAYTLNSFTYSSLLGKYEFAYGVFMPTVTAYYVVSGSGYNFKFGGGIGPRFVSVNETLPPIAAASNYKSSGFGFLLRADGNTALSSNLYANIGADIRYDINGEPKNGANAIFNNPAGQNVNLNSFSFGLHLGISYIF